MLQQRIELRLFLVGLDEMEREIVDAFCSNVPTIQRTLVSISTNWREMFEIKDFDTILRKLEGITTTWKENVWNQRFWHNSDKTISTNWREHVWIQHILIQFKDFDTIQRKLWAAKTFSYMRMPTAKIGWSHPHTNGSEFKIPSGFHIPTGRLRFTIYIVDLGKCGEMQGLCPVKSFLPKCKERRIFF